MYKFAVYFDMLLSRKNNGKHYTQPRWSS